MQGCVGTHTSCSTAITKHTVCNKGLINIIFGQQLTLCYTTMQSGLDITIGVTATISSTCSFP